MSSDAAPGVATSDAAKGGSSPPRTLTFFIGDSTTKVFDLRVVGNVTLRRVIETLSVKRNDFSLLKRIPRDSEGNSLDLDKTLHVLGVTEIYCSPGSPVREKPNAETLEQLLSRLGFQTPEEQTSALVRLADDVAARIKYSTGRIERQFQERHFQYGDLLSAICRVLSLPEDEACLLAEGFENYGLIAPFSTKDHSLNALDQLYRFVLPPDDLPPTDEAASRFHNQFWSISVTKSHSITSEDVSNDADGQNLIRLASYLPSVVLHDLAVRNEDTKLPVVTGIDAALLLADVSGFSTLTAKLVSCGPKTFQRLSARLSDFYNSIVTIITNHGGDLVRVTGDSFLALWPTARPEGLSYSSHLAVSCARHLREELGSFDAEGIVIRLHIGISAGKLFCLHVGGEVRTEFAVTGEALVEAATCQAVAKPGQIYLSSKVTQLLGSRIVVKPHLVNESQSPPSARPMPQNLIRVIQPPTLPTVSIPVPINAAAALRTYCPEPIASSDVSAPTEVRTLTILYIDLAIPRLDSNSPERETRIQILQRTVLYIQSRIAQMEGSIRHLAVDDRGAVLKAAFGLPGKSHPNDPVRALQTATSILDKINESDNVKVSIGVTTGSVVCGTIGTKDRREYILTGDVVTLAMNLMMQNKGKVLCDRATFQLANYKFSFETLEPISIRGRTFPVDVFSVRKELGGTDTSGSEDLDSARGLHSSCDELTDSEELAEQDELSDVCPRHQLGTVGRAKEIQILRDLVMRLAGSSGSDSDDSRLQSPRKCNLLCIEGEYGVGKTRLAEELVAFGDRLGLRSAFVTAQSFDEEIPFGCFKRLISTSLEFETRVGRTGTIPSAYIVQQTEHAQHAFQRRVSHELERYFPLLRDILPELAIEDSPKTAQLSGLTRVTKLLDVCLALIESLGINILLLDNAQWMDSLSWALAKRLMREWVNSTRMLAVCIRSPIIENSFAAQSYEALRTATTCEIHTLHPTPFTVGDLKLLIGQKAGVLPENVDDDLCSFVLSVSKGNPLFVTELLSEMLQKGEIVVDSIRCKLSMPVKGEVSSTTGGVESAMTSIVMGQLEAFNASQQLVLKVAATIGHEIRTDLLYSVLLKVSEKRVGRRHFDAMLSLFKMKGVINCWDATPTVIEFRVPAMASVIYNNMLSSQKKYIHMKIANWYANHESIVGVNQLAHHLKCAQDWPRALAFMSRCGLRSAQTGAHKEAIALLSSCVESFPKLSPEAAQSFSLQRITWLRSLGEEKYHLFDFYNAIKHFEEGLQCMNSTLPAAGVASVPHLVDDLKRKIAKFVDLNGSLERFGDFLWKQGSNKVAQASLARGGKEEVWIYSTYAVIRAYTNGQSEYFFCALTALKRAARLGLISEYVMCLGLALHILAMTGNHKSAEALLPHVVFMAWKLSKEKSQRNLMNLGRAHVFLGAYYTTLGLWKIARSNFARAVEYFVGCSQFGMINETYVWWIDSCFFSGDWGEMDEILDRAFRSDEQFGGKASQMLFKSTLGVRYIFQRRDDLAAPLVMEMGEVCRHIAAPSDVPSLTVGQVFDFLNVQPLRLALIAHSGDIDALKANLFGFVEYLEHCDHVSIHNCLAVVFLGEAAIALRRALVVSDGFVARVSNLLKGFAKGFQFIMAFVLILEGDLLAIKGDEGEAKVAYEKAARVARQMNTRPIEALALFRCGELENVAALLREQHSPRSPRDF